jgi:cobyric acid synthase
MKKIGFLNVKGALPGFEDFGNLPTHLVKNNGLVNGNKAHKELDGLIIPGGSIIESQSVGEDLKREIRKMESEGKFIFGMCSGFQLLANKTDIGRKSPCPIEKEGLGLLDVSFSPMIGTDRVEAEVIDGSFLTDGMIGQKVTGFHCHTYGKITGDAKPILRSLVKRTDYADNQRRIFSGVRNDDGNVVGVMVHGSLDYNPALVQNILKFIDADEKDVSDIQSANKNLLNEIKGEIGIGTGISPDCNLQGSLKSVKTAESMGNIMNVDRISTVDRTRTLDGISTVDRNPETPKAIMMVATGSDSGKTFLTTGIVGVLRKRGYRVCVLKVGPDIRDIVPSLYLTKEKMETFSSIKIGGLGWKNIEDILKDIKSQGYDLVIVEGVMSVFTGLLNEKTPFSSAEIAKASNMPVILVSACNKGGIETAAVDIVGHVEMMDKIGLKTRGVILNKVYDEKIAESAASFIRKRTGLDFVGEVPKVKLTERGNVPEVEIKLEEFCFNAIRTVEKYLDVDEIVSMAEKPKFEGYSSYKTILDTFS